MTLFTRPCDENESNQIRNCLDELGIWIDEDGLCDLEYGQFVRVRPGQKHLADKFRTVIQALVSSQKKRLSAGYSHLKTNPSLLFAINQVGSYQPSDIGFRDKLGDSLTEVQQMRLMKAHTARK